MEDKGRLLAVDYHHQTEYVKPKTYGCSSTAANLSSRNTRPLHGRCVFLPFPLYCWMRRSSQETESVLFSPSHSQINYPIQFNVQSHWPQWWHNNYDKSRRMQQYSLYQFRQLGNTSQVSNCNKPMPEQLQMQQATQISSVVMEISSYHQKDQSTNSETRQSMFQH